MGVFHSFSLIELVLTLLALGLWKFIQLNDSLNAVQTCVSFISRLIQSVMYGKVSCLYVMVIFRQSCLQYHQLDILIR